MHLDNLDTVIELKTRLADADAVVQAFERAPGETVDAYAAIDASFPTRRAHVQLLPVEKSVAVSAARRAREKIVERLRALGVTVEPRSL